MDSVIQKGKAEMFLKFHGDKEILVLLNSWNMGSSKLLEPVATKQSQQDFHFPSVNNKTWALPV